MRQWTLPKFGVENLKVTEAQAPQPGPNEIVLDVKAFCLNYRDLMVIQGGYNPELKLPVVPMSDAAGVVAEVGDGVTRVKTGDQVMTHFVGGWVDGPYKLEYVKTTLGTPGPGFAAQQAVVSADAVLSMPRRLDFKHACTLPIAALTAWSSLKRVCNVQAGDTVLTLGTGGVAIFTLQLATALGAKVIITSSSDEKLQQCKELGAAHTINYAENPQWHEKVLEITQGYGVDWVVETAGPGTLDQSMQSARAGGTIALPGALTGRAGNVTTGLMLMKRLTVGGILVDNRVTFEEMVRFIEEKELEPVISREFAFDQLPDALQLMEAGGHFGKIVVNV